MGIIRPVRTYLTVMAMRTLCFRVSLNKVTIGWSSFKQTQVFCFCVTAESMTQGMRSIRKNKVIFSSILCHNSTVSNLLTKKFQKWTDVLVRPLILVKVQPVKLRFTHCSHCLRDKRCRHFLNCGCFKYWSFRLSKPAERLFSIKWDITSPDQHFEFDGHVYKHIHLALTCLSGYTLYPSDVKGREAGRQLGNPSLWIW